jgi:hypothetical protein
MLQARIRALQELLGFRAADELLSVAPEALTRVPSALKTHVEGLGRVLGVGAEALGPLLVKCWELSTTPISEVEERVEWVEKTLGFQGLWAVGFKGSGWDQEHQLGRKRAKPPAVKPQPTEVREAGVEIRAVAAQGDLEGSLGSHQSDWRFRFFREAPQWLVYEQKYLERQLGKVREVLGLAAEHQGNRVLSRVLWEAPALVTLQGLQKRVDHLQQLLDSWPTQQQQQKEQRFLAGQLLPPAAADAGGSAGHSRTRRQQQQHQQQSLGVSYGQHVSQKFPQVLLLPPKQLFQLSHQLQDLLPGFGPEQLFPILCHKQQHQCDPSSFELDQVNVHFDQVKYLQQLGLLEGLPPQEQQQAVVNALVNNAAAFAESQPLYSAWSATQQLLAVAPSSRGLTKCYDQLLAEQGLADWLRQMEGKWGRVLCLLASSSSSSSKAVGQQLKKKKGAGLGGSVGLKELAGLDLWELAAALQPASRSTVKSKGGTGGTKQQAAAVTAATSANAGQTDESTPATASATAAAAASGTGVNWELLPPPLLITNDSLVWQVLGGKAAERQGAVAAGQQLWHQLQHFAAGSSTWQQQLLDWQELLPEALAAAEGHPGDAQSSGSDGLGAMGRSSLVFEEGGERVYQGGITGGGGGSDLGEERSSREGDEGLVGTSRKDLQKQEQQLGEEQQEGIGEAALLNQQQQQVGRQLQEGTAEAALQKQQQQLQRFWQRLLQEQQQQQQPLAEHQLLSPSLQRLQYLSHTQQQHEMLIWDALTITDEQFTSRFPLQPLWAKTAAWVQGKQPWEQTFWTDLQGVSLLDFLGLLRRDAQRVRRLEYLVTGREVGREGWRGIGLKEAVEMDQGGFVQLFPESKYRAWQMLNRLEIQGSPYDNSSSSSSSFPLGGGGMEEGLSLSAPAGNASPAAGVDSVAPSPASAPRGVWRVTELRHQELASRCQTLIQFASEVPPWDAELQRWSTSNWWYLSGIFSSHAKQPRLEYLSLLPVDYQASVEWTLKAPDEEFSEMFPHFPLWNKLRGVVAGDGKWGRQWEQLQGEQLLRVFGAAVVAVSRGSERSSGSGTRVAAAESDMKSDTAAAAPAVVGYDGGGGGGNEGGSESTADADALGELMSDSSDGRSQHHLGLGEAKAATAAAASLLKITRSQVTAALPLILKRLHYILPKRKAADSLSLTEALTMPQSEFEARFPNFLSKSSSSSSSSSSGFTISPLSSSSAAGDLNYETEASDESDSEGGQNRTSSSSSSSSSSSNIGSVAIAVTNPSGKFGAAALPDEIWLEMSESVRHQLMDHEGALLKGLAVFVNSHPVWQAGMRNISARGWERMVQYYEKGYRKADFIVR